ncbi:hypothetical protein IAE38_000351 [Pseudomonas sp. S32]|nr:hypothetical protein [Pseudomonas sp. S32]
MAWDSTKPQRSWRGGWFFGISYRAGFNQVGNQFRDTKTLVCQYFSIANCQDCRFNNW